MLTNNQSSQEDIEWVVKMFSKKIVGIALILIALALIIVSYGFSDKHFGGRVVNIKKEKFINIETNKIITNSTSPSMEIFNLVMNDKLKKIPGITIKFIYIIYCSASLAIVGMFLLIKGVYLKTVTNIARKVILEIILFLGSVTVALRFFFPPHYIQLADREGYVNKIYQPTQKMMDGIKENGYYQWNDYIIGTLQPDYLAALWQSVAIAVVTFTMFFILKKWMTNSKDQTKE